MRLVVLFLKLQNLPMKSCSTRALESNTAGINILYTCRGSLSPRSWEASVWKPLNSTHLGSCWKLLIMAHVLSQACVPIESAGRACQAVAFFSQVEFAVLPMQRFFWGALKVILQELPCSEKMLWVKGNRKRQGIATVCVCNCTTKSKREIGAVLWPVQLVPFFNTVIHIDVTPAY